MTKQEYDDAMADACGDADEMLWACYRRLDSLTELLDWAETLLCNAAPMPHCTNEKWTELITKWRDEKHGAIPIVKSSP